MIIHSMIRIFTLLLLFSIVHGSTIAQNASINIQIQKGGIVKVGESLFLEVWVNNTDADYPIPVYKLKPQISLSEQSGAIALEGHVLPEGWNVLSNQKGVITLSNGMDIIGPGDARTILIAIIGKSTGGPFTLAGKLIFANGMPPGNTTGPATPNDIPADNFSTTTFSCVK